MFDIVFYSFYRKYLGEKREEGLRVKDRHLLSINIRGGD